MLRAVFTLMLEQQSSYTEADYWLSLVQTEFQTVLLLVIHEQVTLYWICAIQEWQTLIVFKYYKLLHFIWEGIIILLLPV